MSRINRVPFGLQDLLGSTNQGDNPSVLDEVATPVLELGAFLSAERRWFNRVNPVSKTSDGSIDSLIVPSGEQWFVQAIGCIVTPVGTGTPQVHISAACNLINNSNNGTQLHALADLGYIEAANAGGSFCSLTYDFPNPVPFFGSEKITWYASEGNYTSVSYTCTPTIRYTKLKV
jgi:hypothetical protein